jgi:hypothetical protein
MVAEKMLDGNQINSPLNKPSSKGVPEVVKSNAELRFFTGIFKRCPDALVRKNQGFFALCAPQLFQLFE